MDIEDYVTSGFIGSRNPHKATCTDWEDAATTYRATSNALFSAINYLIDQVLPLYKAYPNESIGSPRLAFINEFVYNKFFRECYIDYKTQSDIFWNSQSCVDKKIGLITIEYRIPNADGNNIDVPTLVDFGDGNITQEIWNNYENSFKALMCCIKQLMILLNGEELMATDFTEFNEIPIVYG